MSFKVMCSTQCVVTSLGQAVQLHITLWISKLSFVHCTTPRPGTRFCSELILPILASGLGVGSHFQVSSVHSLPPLQCAPFSLCSVFVWLLISTSIFLSLLLGL